MVEPSTLAGASATDATSIGIETGSQPLSGAKPDGDALDRTSLKDRIDGLLAQQVQRGTLTELQADALKTAFGKLTGGQNAEAEVPDAPQASPLPTTVPSSTDILATFVKQLQSAQDRPPAYGADGTRFHGQTASPLLLNFKA